MKTKKLAKSIVAVMLGATMSASMFAFAACGDEDHKHSWGEYVSAGANGHYQVCDDCDEHSDTVAHVYDDENDAECNLCGYTRTIIGDVEDPTKATITVTADKTEINAGSTESVQAIATIEGLTDKSVVWSLSGDGKSYADISQDGKLTLKNTLTPQIDQAVKIVATSTVFSSVTNSVTIIIKAPVIPGQVGELTTEMFETLGNSSITVTGEVVDVYDDLQNDNNDVERAYEYKVMMSDGAWYGAWNRKGYSDVDESNYRRADDGSFDEVYIDKNNEVAHKTVTDYMSIAAEWNEQHLWNHLAQLGNDVENQWEYNASSKLYIYKFDNNSVEDIYLRTYLAFSLTPMLGNSDTLEQIALTVEDGAITKLEARTYVQYEGSEKEGSSEGATAMSYTNLTAVFSDVGETTVPDPAPYDAPEFAEVLEAALANMGNATNYTFSAVETTVSAPSYDDYDYSVDTASSANYRARSVANTTSATGTVGLVGEVTEDAVLLARTDKYSYAMSGNLYHTEYSGYKQIDDDTYDYFAYDANEGALVGQRQYKGNLFDSMPNFDFSANIFEWDSTEYRNINGQKVGFHNFTLRESAVTRDVAMQVSAHTYAGDAQGSTYGSLKITVTDTGVVYSTEFPYSLVAGTYLGVIQTTYSKIGTTVLDEDIFDTYQARELRDNWGQYDVMYYHADHSTLSGYDEIDGATLLKNIFGSADYLPGPMSFYEVFGDAMSGPFFDWKEIDNTATGGTIEYVDYVSFNLQVEDYDENGMISKATYDDTISALTAEFAKYGFVYSAGQSTGYGDMSRMTFINAEHQIAIRVENNRTRHFSVYFMPLSLITG